MGFIAPFLPAIIQGAGAVLGGIGGSGKQGQFLQEMLEEFTKTGKSTSTTSGTGKETSTTSGLQEMLEDPTFAQFRSDLIPMLSQQINKAKQPIYGDAQKAGLMNQLNELAGGATSALKQQLAASGGLDSGLLSQGVGDIQNQRFGQLSSFFSQLPFMESEAQAARMNPLLGLATNWVGKAPLSSRFTGFGSSTSEQQQTSVTDSTESGTSKRSGSATQEGPGFWRQLAGDLGHEIGAGGLDSIFKPKPKSRGGGGINPYFKPTLPTNPFNIGGNI